MKIVKSLTYLNSTYFNVPVSAEIDLDGEIIKSPIPLDVIETAYIKQQVNELRVERNKLLLQTDWTQMPDAPLTAEQKTEFAEYRQALRDITNNLDNPDEVVWPTKPTH